MDTSKCNASMLPLSEQYKVHLLRRGNSVYKFKILNSNYMKKLVRAGKESKLQLDLLNAMDNVLCQCDVLSPRQETQVTMTELCEVHIQILPWSIAEHIYFENSLGDRKYSAGKLQFVLTVKKLAFMKSVSTDDFQMSPFENLKKANGIISQPSSDGLENHKLDTPLLKGKTEWNEKDDEYEISDSDDDQPSEEIFSVRKRNLSRNLDIVEKIFKQRSGPIRVAVIFAWLFSFICIVSNLVEFPEASSLLLY